MAKKAAKRKVASKKLKYSRSAGSDVTLVEMAPRLVPLEDEAIGRELQKQFEARGIHCLVGMTLDPSSAERNEGGVAVTVHGEGGEKRLQATVLLVAVGRAGNVEDIGLEQAGVAVERGVVSIDGAQRTSVAGISAVPLSGAISSRYSQMTEESITGRRHAPASARLHWG